MPDLLLGALYGLAWCVGCLLLLGACCLPFVVCEVRRAVDGDAGGGQG